MIEAEARAAIVAAARAWVGTPYHHEGDVRGIGVDCGMILVRVFVDLGLVAPFDPRPYPRDFMLHNGEERYLSIVEACGARQVPEDRVGPGDVVVWRWGRVYSHGGIVTDWPNIVHAYSRAGKVSEADLSLPSILSDPRRARRVYSLW